MSATALGRKYEKVKKLIMSPDIKLKVSRGVQTEQGITQIPNDDIVVSAMEATECHDRWKGLSICYPPPHPEYYYRANATCLPFKFPGYSWGYSLLSTNSMGIAIFSFTKRLEDFETITKPPSQKLIVGNIVY